MTNFEKIKNMSLEQLAAFMARPLCEKCAWYGKCKTDENLTCDGKGQLEWLKQEVENNER